MTTTDADPVSPTIRQLEALAEDLTDRGFEAHVIKDGNRARVSVAHHSVPQLSERAHTAPTGDGQWWFWWSWGDQIARITEIETAAFKIAYVLTPHTHD